MEHATPPLNVLQTGELQAEPVLLHLVYVVYLKDHVEQQVARTTLTSHPQTERWDPPVSTLFVNLPQMFAN